MALITDYTTLQAAVASYLKRDDLTGDIPMLIQMAEHRIWRELRSHYMITTDEDTLTGGAFLLPSDFLELISFSISYSNDWHSLEPLPPGKELNGDDSSTPYGYILRGGSVRVEGGSGVEDIRYAYWRKPGGSAISASNAGLLDKFPDIYLYATLLEAAPFLKNDARIAVWQAAYSRSIETENASSLSSRYASSARIKPVHYAP